MRASLHVFLKTVCATRACVYTCVQLNTKCVDEESRGQSIIERAGGCCEPVLDIPKATSEQFG